MRRKQNMTQTKGTRKRQEMTEVLSLTGFAQWRLVPFTLVGAKCLVYRSIPDTTRCKPLSYRIEA